MCNTLSILNWNGVYMPEFKIAGVFFEPFKINALCVGLCSIFYKNEKRINWN